MPTSTSPSASGPLPTPPEIVVTRFDHDRLSRLIERLHREGRDTAASDALEDELERATVVDTHDVPATIVTMNSEVETVSLDTGETRHLTIVFPAQASPRDGRISVLAPLGLAMLGARVGDEITWTMPGGPRRLRVQRIHFQPESAGHFDL